MAKQTKTLPARKPRDRSRDDDSLLLQSAESLGRVIGALQRQLDEATRRLSNRDRDAATGTVPKRKAKKRSTAKAASAAKQTRRARPRTTRKAAKKR
jgi:hypothetical protein